MIKVIAGEKGTGKTAQLVDQINEQASNEQSNIVCIEKGNRLDRLLKYKIRLIDISEYPTSGFNELLSFIAGISAKDYDLTHVYIDSIFKVSQSDDLSELELFLNKLDKFLAGTPIEVSIILSTDLKSLPDGVKKYC